MRSQKNECLVVLSTTFKKAPSPMMHEVSLCLLFLSVDARLNQRRLQTLSGSVNADVLWSHQFGSGCQVNTAPLVVDQNVLVSVHCGSEETLRFRAVYRQRLHRVVADGVVQ